MARLARLWVRRPFLGRGRRRPLIVLLGLVAIVAWQAGFVRRANSLESRYTLSASTGLNQESRFVYFYYYLGLYPVVSREGHLPYLDEPGYRRFSREAAGRLIAERGRTLLMEWKHTIRTGDLGKMFLYLPDAWLKGEPDHLSLRPTHVGLFVLALCALWTALWWQRQPVLGLTLVALMGSNPFQLYEAYARENVFSWPISTALLVLALNLPLLLGRRTSLRAAGAIALATGLLLGSIRQVRSEPTAMLLAAIMACAFVAGVSWRRRLTLVGVLGVSFVGTSALWTAYFEHKFEEARQVVAAAGGHAYPGPRDRHHALWHPVWCGLGDFDTKYGYRWLDVAPARYALPILARDYHVEVPPWDGDSWAHYRSTWDAAGLYYKMPYELPHYGEVLRDKILSDIRRDPLWYLDILRKRAQRILVQTTPVRLVLPGIVMHLPMHGAVLLPVAALLLAWRAWPLLKLVLFTLPTSLPVLVIFSGENMPHYGLYHLVLGALGLSFALELGAAAAISALRRASRRPGRVLARPSA